MKRFVSMMLSVIMLLSFTMTAFADTEISSFDGTDSATTSITYSVGSSYVVYIPEIIEADGSNYYFTASYMDLREDEYVVISISGLESDGSLTLTSSKAGRIIVNATVPGSYDITESSEAVAMFYDGQTRTDTSLQFYVSSMEDVYAGDYSATVTFDVALKNMTY